MKTTACPICKKRREAIKELNEIRDKDGDFLREKRRNRDISAKEDGYVEELDECPACRKEGKTQAMNDFGANFEQNTHYHRCGICGTRMPKDEKKAYKGTFVCSDLGDKSNGELLDTVTPKHDGKIRE